MGKKGFEADLSISVLLTVPDTAPHALFAEQYLGSLPYSYRRVFLLNKDQENFPIESIRDMISQTQYATTEAESQVFVLCGIEKASIPAQNALLKILEEPPVNTGFLLVQSEGSPVLPTIISRCILVSQTVALKTPSQKTDEPEESFLSETVQFFLNPQTKNYTDLIDLAEQWNKSESREKFLTKILNLLLQEKNPPLIALEKIREALESLGKNGNVKLVIEHCFFTIKEHTSKKQT